MTIYKILHMTASALTLLFFVFMVISIFFPSLTKLKDGLSQPTIKILQHLTYTLLVLCGIFLMYPLVKMKVMPWWIALKIILFITILILFGLNKRKPSIWLAVSILMSTLLIIALIALKPFGLIGGNNNTEASNVEEPEEISDEVIDELALDNQEEVVEEDPNINAENVDENAEENPDSENTDTLEEPIDTDTENTESNTDTANTTK